MNITGFEPHSAGWYLGVMLVVFLAAVAWSLGTWCVGKVLARVAYKRPPQ